MNTTYTETETRAVSGFDRVAIRGYTCSAQLFITQGEQEALSIEAPSEYIPRLSSEVKNRKLILRLEGSWLQGLEDVLTNCVTKPHICYRLAVREFTYLEVQCAYSIHASRIETPRLQLKLNGTGDVRLNWLSAEKLDVHHSGSGIMQISGQVEEQTIVMNGVGSYIAPGLDSQRAHVRMLGTGRARVHVNQALNITLRGVGRLEYSGEAQVRKRVSGPGQILRIAQVNETAA